MTMNDSKRDQRQQRTENERDRLEEIKRQLSYVETELEAAYNQLDRLREVVERSPDDATAREEIGANVARERSIGIERLNATERDVLVAVAGAGSRVDPRTGAPMDEITEEIKRFYDHKHVSEISVELVCDYLGDLGLVELVEDDRYRVTVDAIGDVEAYLGRVGRLWDGVPPWEDGTKIVIESRQVGEPEEVSVDP